MKLGQRIRQLRMNKGVTQEALAESLGVTYQAVSRWENDITMPDITLLPKLSVYFGITIDELFELTAEAQLERINNRMDEEATLTDEVFNNAKAYLEKQLREKPDDVIALQSIARLYDHRAKGDMQTAARYAKAALEYKAESKDINNILIDAYGGVHTDWNYYNHHELIDYYYEYTKNNPKNILGYHYLLDHLIADGRTAEARKVLSEIADVDSSLRLLNYEGKILLREGDSAGAEQAWRKMTDENPDSWLAWALLADRMADVCRYDEAVEMYRKSMVFQEKPRYSDSLEAISHICEIKGDYSGAIETTQDILDLLRDEWNLTFGTVVNKYKQRIELLMEREV